jgi:hypothetical protein
MTSMNHNTLVLPKWENNVVVMEDDTTDDMNDIKRTRSNTFELVENDHDMKTVTVVEQNGDIQDDDDKTGSIDIWEHVHSSIHSVLLKEVWIGKTDDDMINALDRLWSSCVATTTNETSTSSSSMVLLEDDTKYIRHDTEIEIFYTLGGYSIIVGIMNKCHHHDIIQEKCCVLLGVICMNHTELICHALYSDVVRCIVRGMVTFPNKEQIQLKACYALNTLSEHNNYDACTKIMGQLDDTIETENHSTNNDDKTTNYHVTGLQVIIGAMKTYPHNSLLQYYGCSLLYNLTFEDFLSDLRTVGAMGVLAAAMETHPQHSKIQEMARNAMMELL